MTTFRRIRPAIAIASAIAAATIFVHALRADGEPSGKPWVKKFPGSNRIDDLEEGFREKAKAFLKAATDGGAEVKIASTRRPRERAYLMHWSWMIVNRDQDAKKIPAMKGVDIDWWHGDQAASVKKAQEMVDGYGMRNLKVPPALSSRHIEGKAIDMQIVWSGDLKIKKSDGSTVEIRSTPRDNTNPDLIAVGATYGVIHFTDVPKDRVHWSTDGR
jgi:hypothetical protein